jgi:hypothetical protein
MYPLHLDARANDPRVSLRALGSPLLTWVDAACRSGSRQRAPLYDAPGGRIFSDIPPYWRADLYLVAQHLLGIWHLISVKTSGICISLLVTFWNQVSAGS